MRYRRVAPAPPLRATVAYLWCLSDGPTHPRERILPTGSAELVINLGADEISIRDESRDARYCGAVFTGPYTRPFDIDAAAHRTMVGVHFKPGGAQAFLSVPLGELADTHINLEDLWGTRTLRTQMGEATSDAERIDLLERALLTHLVPDHQPRAAVSSAVRGLADGASRVGDIAALTGLSHRRFTDVFSAGVGMTPKLFARLCRFQRALDCIGAARGWAEFAAAHGFSDQAHMIREFQAFSGLTPVEHIAGRAHPAKDDHIALVG